MMKAITPPELIPIRSIIRRVPLWGTFPFSRRRLTATHLTRKVAAAYGYLDDKDALVGRLHPIDGQVRGIERMISAERYFIDILTQISAATTALDAVERFARPR